MRYTFTGELYGTQCEQTRPIGEGTVKLYRHDQEARATHSVAARTAETFAILDEKQIEAKADRLLATGEIESDGSFSVTLDEEQDYDGEAFDVDVVLDGIDGQQGETVHATITTVQPRWYKGEEGPVASWEHQLPQKNWCAILETLGIWVVCGRVTDCESEKPVTDATVSVTDRDIVQDDTLGSATTDADGEYCIYYRVADFERIPFGLTPVELTPGPDLYFEVRGPGGTVLLDEDPSMGREKGRENVGPCACMDLCVDFEGDRDRPLFTHVGRFNVFQDIAPNGTLVRSRNNLGGPGWGFFGHVPLEGFVPAADTGQTYYRFLYEVPGESPKPVVGDQLDRTTVGGKLVPDPSSPTGLAWQEIHVAGSAGSPDPGLDPAPKTVVPTAGNRNDDENGWIPVDPDAHGGGYGHGPLLELDTTAIVPGSAQTATAGSAPSSPASGEQVTVYFETTTEAPGGGPDTSAIDRQADAVTLYVNNHPEVRELAIFDGNGGEIGCSPADGVTVKYTADHEFLTSWGLSVSSPAEKPSVHGWTAPSLSGQNIDRGANAPGTARGVARTENLNVDSWPSCTYEIQLTTRRALTNGRRGDDPDSTPGIDGMFYKP